MVTLKTIASSCGLSISAVSQILNNRSCDYSSESTRRLVRETARRLGYRRNYGYRLMRGQRTRTVTVLTSMAHSRNEENIRVLILLILDCLEQEGYTCMLGSFGEDEEANLDKVREYISRGTEHFIILHTPVGYKKIEELIEGSGKTLMAVSPCFRRHVYVSSYAATKELVSFLRSQCGDDMRILLASNHINEHNPRLRAFCTGFPELSAAEVISAFVRSYSEFHFNKNRYIQESFNAAYAWTEELLRREPDVTGIICGNDNFALGAASYIVKSGRRLGKDILLAGFNDDTAVQQYPYPISSGNHDWDKRVKQIVHHALQEGECRKIFDARAVIRKA